jgi:hypothetical protein
MRPGVPWAMMEHEATPAAAPGKPNELRLQAENCLTVARLTDNANLRRTLLDMAYYWFQRAQASESKAASR